MSSNSLRQSTSWTHWALIALMVAAIAILMIGLLSWQISFGAQVELALGAVAPANISAPHNITYVSPILTDQARDRAAGNVPEQYDMAESRVRRTQVEHARDIMEYIGIVRQDEYATPELKTDYLLAIADVPLTPEIARLILDFSNSEWAQVAEEVPTALDAIMREEIRESTLLSARRRVPSMVNIDSESDKGKVAETLVRELIRPNSFVNQMRTELLRDEARGAVADQEVTIKAGEAIIRAGDVATSEDVEALQQIGLLRSERDLWVYLRAAIFTLIVLAVVGVSLFRLHPATLGNVTEMAILVVVSGLWLVAAKFMIIQHTWLPFLYPLAALGMMFAVLIDLRVSIIITIAFLFVLQYLDSGNPELIVYAGVGTLLGAMVLGRGERLISFAWAGIAVAAGNLAVMAAYHAPFDLSNASLPVESVIVPLVNGGLAASIALIGYFTLGSIFGITTSLQLTELSRPTHPLLRQLLLKAPGTYHHTIVVSNLAERAAAAIDADAFLCRVGAYYHDIGKTVRPYFFTENIMDETSPHDRLDPLTSAQIIVSHVTDGLDLAEKYHLPPRIRDFIREHHGRSLVRYFYVKAMKEAPEGVLVDEADFRYPGPNPRSKETAIMLLADTCEAAVRATRPSSREELKALVDRLIDERINDGELDESNLTFKEVQQVKDVFVRVLEGVHHPRIQYPEPADGAAVDAAAELAEIAANGEPAAAGSDGDEDVPRVDDAGVEEILERA